jgi:hypothetical protein
MREVEQGKKSDRLENVNQVLDLFGIELVVVPKTEL